MALGDTPIIDLFNTAGGPPPPGAWASDPFGKGGGVVVAGGVAKSSVVSHIQGGHAAYRTDISVADAEAHFLLDAIPPAGIDIWAVLRVNTTSFNGYAASFQNVNGTQFDWQCFKVTAGALVQLGASVQQTFAVGDRIGARMEGTTLTMWRRAGDTGTPTSILTRTDGTYTAAGRIGFAMCHNVAAIRDFGGGSTTIADTTPPANVTDLALSQPTAGTIQANFTTPADVDTSHYKIRYKAGTAQTFSSHTDGTSFLVETATTSSDAEVESLAGFTPGAAYTVAVFVRDSTGNYNSGATASITLTSTEATGLSLSEPVSGTIGVSFVMPAQVTFEAYKIRYKAGTAQTFSSHTDGTEFLVETEASPSDLISRTKSGFAAASPFTIGVFVKDNADVWSAGVTASITLGALARRSPPGNPIQVFVASPDPDPDPDPDDPPPPPPPPPPDRRPYHDYDVARGLRTGTYVPDKERIVPDRERED